MNRLADQFQLSFAPQARQEAVVQGSNYRFTILTERLIRLEYDPEGEFEDHPSQVVWYREQPVPDFKVNKTDEKVVVETEYLKLIYKIKESGFNKNSLRIELKELNNVWHYDDENEGNLGGTIRTLDTVNGSAELDQGLLSRTGWSIIEDTDSLVFTNNDGWVESREAAADYEDLYFFGYGHDYISCLQDFQKIAGEVPLLPRWALGNWWSRYWEYSQQGLKDLILKFKSKNVPLSVCIIDMDWHLVDNPYTNGWTGYTWNRDLFPKPEEFINWLHNQGLKTALNLHPADGVHPHEAKYEEMAEFMGVEPKTEEPINFDVADPQFINGYFEILHHPLEEQGIDFWWLDWQQGRDSGLDGLDPLWGLNHLHFYDRARQNNKRPFIFSRWSGIGSHRYPIGFSGDTIVSWESLKFQPYFTAAASNVAYSWWSHDIGGHCQGREDAELYARWVQFGVFSPIMRLHSTKDYYLDRHPWGHGEEVYQITKDMMQLRHALIPYLYTMSWQNEKEGLPVIRPMYYYHAEQEAAYNCPQQYYFGSELVAAPFVQPQDEETGLSRQTVWLPEGDWFDFFTGEHYQGDSWQAEYGKLDEVPVFARAGAIVPLAPKVEWGGVEPPSEFNICIFPGADNTYTLYEDKGTTLNYKEGEYVTREFVQQWSDEELIFKIEPAVGECQQVPEQRTYNLQFKGIDCPEEITVELNGDQISPKLSYNQAEATLMIELKQINFEDMVKVNLAAETELIARRQRREEKIRKLLKAFNMPTAPKSKLEAAIKQAEDESLSYLKDFAVVLSDNQLQALIEVLGGVGFDRITNQEQDRIILWANSSTPKLTYHLSTWDVTKSHQRQGAWSETETVSGLSIIDIKEELADIEWELKIDYSDLLREKAANT